jgi:hypothetical protein
MTMEGYLYWTGDHQTSHLASLSDLVLGGGWLGKHANATRGMCQKREEFQDDIRNVGRMRETCKASSSHPMPK